MTDREEIKNNALTEEELKQVSGGTNDGAFPYLYQTIVINETEFLSAPRNTFEEVKRLDTLVPGQQVRVINSTLHPDYQQRQYLLCKKNIGYMAEGYILADDLAPQSSK